MEGKQRKKVQSATFPRATLSLEMICDFNLSIKSNLIRQLRVRNSGMMDNLPTIHTFRKHGCMILNLGTTHKFSHKYIRMMFNFTHHTKAVQEVLGVLKQLPFKVSWRPRDYVRGLKDSLDYVDILRCVRKIVMSVRPSIFPQGTTRLPLDGFSWTLIFYYFSKVCRESYSFIKIGQSVFYMNTNIHLWSISLSSS
jgi:hypothetical protein